MDGTDKPKRGHVKRPGANISESLRRYHASRTPQQRAAWRSKVGVGTSAGMHVWHAGRSDADREHSRQLQIDAAVARMFLPRQPGIRFPKGHDIVASNDSLQRREFARVRAASITRILKEVVTDDPDLIRRAIREGLASAPPRSAPYLILAAAYLDGKPVDSSDELHAAKREDLSDLTRDELLQRALSVAKRLRLDAQASTRNVESTLPIIDITPESAR